MRLRYNLYVTCCIRCTFSTFYICSYMSSGRLLFSRFGCARRHFIAALPFNASAAMTWLAFLSIYVRRNCIRNDRQIVNNTIPIRNKEQNGFNTVHVAQIQVASGARLVVRQPIAFLQIFLGYFSCILLRFVCLFGFCFENHQPT